MTTLAANKARTYEFNEDPLYEDVGLIASDIIYAGAAVGESSSSGTARPLVAADTFLGFAVGKADNSSGSASDITVRLRKKGTVKIPVTGAASAADVGATVYADDDNAFTLTSSSNSSIGKVTRWISSTTCMVRFEAVMVRSL